MKKLIILCSAAAICFTIVARPGPGPKPSHRPSVHHITPHHHHRHHHHHHSGHFWTGVGVGLLGGLITSSYVAPATPPPSPVVVGPVIQSAPQRVWVPPVYGERPIYRAGIYVGTERYIITPGYWTTSY